MKYFSPVYDILDSQLGPHLHKLKNLMIFPSEIAQTTGGLNLRFGRKIYLRKVVVIWQLGTIFFKE